MMKITIACLLLAALATAQYSDDDFAAETSFFENQDDVVPTNDDQVPESSDTDIHEEARSHVSGLLEMGKTKDACASLAKSSAKAVTDSVGTAQKMMNAVPKGASCAKEGQQTVDSATKAKNNATKKVKDSKAASGSAKSAPVKFKDVNVEDIKDGDCAAFFSDPAYTSAKKAAEAAGNKQAKAEGELKIAKKALDDALAAQKRAINYCSCQTKKKHAEAAAAASKANSSENAKAWKKAHMMECVLEGKEGNACKVPPVPKVTVPALEAPAKGAVCKATDYGKIHEVGSPCQDGRNSDLQYLDRQTFSASGGGSKPDKAISTFRLQSSCSNNNYIKAVTGTTTTSPTQRHFTKYTGCTPIVGKKVEWLDRQAPNCGANAALTWFKIGTWGRCNGGNKAYKYMCNEYKYNGGLVDKATSCQQERGKHIAWLDRLRVECGKGYALNSFHLTGSGCGGNNMRYTFKCLKLNYN